MVQAVGAEDDQGPVDRQAAIEQRLPDATRAVQGLRKTQVPPLIAQGRVELGEQRRVRPLLGPVHQAVAHAL